MSGHEFEKQVRQKLDDLRITPTASAWENIEESLREKRRRRAPFIWMPAALLVFAIGGYFYFTSGKNSDEKIFASGGVSKNASRSEKAPRSGNHTTADALDDGIASQKNTPRSGIPSSKDIASGGVLSTEKSSPVKPARINETYSITPRSGNLSVITPHSGAPRSGTVQRSSVPSNKNIASGGVFSSEKSRTIKPARINETLSVTPPSGNPSDFPVRSESPRSEKPLNQKTEKFLSLHSILLQTDPYNTLYTSPSFNRLDPRSNVFGNETNPVPKKINTKKLSKWSYGLSAFAGISAVNEDNFLNFRSPQVEDVAYLAAFAPSAPPYKPSSIRPGFSYSLGAFVKRDLSKKFSLSIGLNYLQLNTHNKVGYQMNGSQIVNNGTRGYLIVSSFYTVDRSDQLFEYRNRYHFLEVPVELHAKINKSAKLPIHVKAGVAVSQLLQSNSLHFDGTTGVYYKNDRLLNQTQVAATTGMSFELFNKTTRPIWIGPSARYNVSKILQKDVSARKNFMSLGVDVKLFIR